MPGSVLDYSLLLQIGTEPWKQVKGLPKLDFTRSIDEGSGEMGGLTFTFPPSDPYARRMLDYIRQRVSIRFRFKPHGGFRHGLYGRVIRGFWDPSDRNSQIEFIARTEEDVLNGIILPQDVSYTQETPGTIGRAMLDIALSRGIDVFVAGGRHPDNREDIVTDPGIAFDADRDSNQVPWPKRLSVKFPAGTSLRQVFSKLSELQVAEYDPADGKMLLYGPEGTGLDYSGPELNPLGGQLTLIPGVHINSMPLELNFQGLATGIFVEGAENVGSTYRVGIAGESQFPLDYREVQPNISDIGPFSIPWTLGLTA